MARKVISLVACVLVLAGTWWILKPEPPLDLSKEEEPFRSMVLPLKSVAGYTYMDQGSVGIELIDNAGAEFDVCFPFDHNGIVNAHPTAYRGNINDSKLVRLNDPTRAKAISIKLMRDYGERGGEPGSTDDAISELSELSAIPSRFWDRAEGWFR